MRELLILYILFYVQSLPKVGFTSGIHNTHIRVLAPLRICRRAFRGSVPCAYFHEVYERRARLGDVEARSPLLGLYGENRLYVHVPATLHLFLSEVLTLYYLIPMFGFIVLYALEYYLFTTIVTVITVLSVIVSVVFTRRVYIYSYSYSSDRTDQ